MMSVVVLNRLLPPEVLEATSLETQQWLTKTFARFGGKFPDLEQIWMLMDEAWVECGCDSAVMDERITEFYNHPVWLLNGLFIEQHVQSIGNRENFARWVVQQRPVRIADYGGGYGSLARMIGALRPEAEVEVIEPHPHALAIARADETNNVRYRSALDGKYDILIATDVFEHVPDPLALVARAAEHLRVGGYFLIANCFEPVILCHLPRTFHFRWTWNTALSHMGLVPAEHVVYGTAFKRVGPLSLEAARRVETKSRRLYRLTHHLPRRFAKHLPRLII